MEMYASGPQLILGLCIGIVLLVMLITKAKVHTFFALVSASLVTAAVCGVPIGQITSIVKDGFGSTLGGIGIIVGIGILLGEVFEMSGAGQKMANVFVDVFGEGREEWAMAVTGFIMSIPVFSDTVMLILFPVAQALSRKSGKSIVTLGMCLMYSAVITHSLVPPTPGPLAAAGEFGVPLGNMIFWGIIVSTPITCAIVFYYKVIGKKMHIIPKLEDGDVVHNDLDLPNAFLSFTPIILPIALIIANTVATAVGVNSQALKIINFIGDPVIALSLSLIFATMTLTRDFTRRQLLDRMENGVKAAGVILLITGGGGAFGMVLRNSGAGSYIGNVIAETPLPAILIPFLIASIVRIIQGSITVSVITAASISAPILSSIPGTSMTFAAVACCVGALSLSYFNDSGFWVQCNLMKLKEPKDQIIACTLQCPIAWLVGLIATMVLNAIFGGMVA